MFCFVAGDQFSTLDGKAIPTMVPCVFWLQRNDPPILLFTTMENCIVDWKSPFSTENDGKIDPNCHSATLDIFAMTYKCFKKSFIEGSTQCNCEIGLFPQGVADTPHAKTDGFFMASYIRPTTGKG